MNSVVYYIHLISGIIVYRLSFIVFCISGIKKTQENDPVPVFLAIYL